MARKSYSEYYADKPVQLARVRQQCAANSKARKDNFRRILNAYKVRTGCADGCEERNPAMLEFDHDDPSTKCDTVSRLIQRGQNGKAVWAEVRKCTVRCIRCHRMRTAKQQNWCLDIAPLAELEDALALEASS